MGPPWTARFELQKNLGREIRKWRGRSWIPNRIKVLRGNSNIQVLVRSVENWDKNNTLISRIWRLKRGEKRQISGGRELTSPSRTVRIEVGPTLCVRRETILARAIFQVTSHYLRLQLFFTVDFKDLTAEKKWEEADIKGGKLRSPSQTVRNQVGPTYVFYMPTKFLPIKLEVKNIIIL